MAAAGWGGLPNDTHIMIRMPQPLRDALQKMAGEERRALSDYCRLVLERFVRKELLAKLDKQAADILKIPIEHFSTDRMAADKAIAAAAKQGLVIRVQDYPDGDALISATFKGKVFTADPNFRDEIPEAICNTIIEVLGKKAN